MRKSLILAPMALALALASVLPAAAQVLPPPAATAEGSPAEAAHPAPPAPTPETASIRADFGGGRKVAVDCGTAALDACVAAALPVIEKVAAAEPVPGAPEDGGRGHGHGHGEAHGKDMKGKPWKPGETAPRG